MNSSVSSELVTVITLVSAASFCARNAPEDRGSTTTTASGRAAWGAALWFILVEVSEKSGSGVEKGIMLV